MYVDTTSGPCYECLSIQVIKTNGGKESATEYFGVLVS